MAERTLPDGWRTVTVDEIKADSTSALATGPFGSSISAKFFQPVGVPVIRGTNLSAQVGERLVEDGFVFVSEEKAAEFKRAVVRAGDLVFTCWGTIGQIGLIDERARYARYVISNKQMKLTPDTKAAISLYLYYALSSPVVSHQFTANAIGSSVPGFNLGQLREIKLPLPPLPEQRAIAGVLGALDDKIEVNRKQARVLEGIARAVFTSWFVDFHPVRRAAAGEPIGLPPDLAALFPKRLVSSPIGKVPEGWRVLPLPEVFEVNPTRSLKKGAAAPYLDMSNMPTQGHAPAEWVRREAASGMRFINGDTLVARITPCLENGKTAFVDFLADGEVAWGSTEYIVLRPKPPLPPVFAYLLARDERFRTHAIQSMTGSSGRQRVPAESLDHSQVAMPTDGAEAIGAAFATIVEPMFARMSMAMKQNRTLAALRDALLPKLISGELRIADAEKIVGRSL